MYNRPIVLSIAGFDPCGGAGLLADVKTLEQQQCLGFGVLTAWTVQTDNTFHKVVWLSLENIKEQAEPLFSQYNIQAVKIGIIQDWEILLDLVQWLKQKNKNLLIIWDTVMASSTGFQLNETKDKVLLESILKQVFLITPNCPEARILSGMEDELGAAKYLSQYTNVLLKGGHSSDVGLDILFTNEQEIRITALSEKLYAKHGSGCILSAAIAAFIAKGIHLEQACRQAKAYIEIALGSNQNLLAYHHV